MSEPAAVVRFPTKSPGKFDARKRIEGTVSPELVIALCGPIGTPLHGVAAVLAQLLKQDYRYDEVEVLRLSSFIRKNVASPETATLKELIAAGNALREEHGPAVLAQLAIRRILLNRIKTQGSSEPDPQISLIDDAKSTDDAVAPTAIVRHCHIIDSIKNKEELSLLRSVYGDMLHVIGVYAPLEQRVQAIGHDFDLTRGQVFSLIDTDSGEEIEHGQSVREVFPQADFFLRAEDGTDEQIASALKRYLDLLLRARIVTPKASERAMYAAYSAARNSACLSRQVGAALTDAEGNLLSTGWNDVPSAFGGLYQTAEAGALRADQRCWNRDGGKCFNDEEKDGIAKLIVDALVEGEVITGAQAAAASAKIRHHTQLRDLIEFSRAVHAEMHALLNAGQTAGAKILGGKLFVTTYPCHSCARHIIAAGIREVYFIEPYRKSRATRLHADAITESESDTTKVRIVPFDGVAPSRYLALFSEPEEGRKDKVTGKMSRHAIVPMTATTLEAVQTLESIATKQLESDRVLTQLATADGGGL